MEKRIKELEEDKLILKKATAIYPSRSKVPSHHDVKIARNQTTLCAV
ncbi:hypothetical protein HMPREF9996_01210 [Aggregatibacter actinomycetemcomitans Y4]|nr:hypothetical protein HMPREF9996_01210 [Aggregatibacter actinomycetemcomitans Y4]